VTICKPWDRSSCETVPLGWDIYLQFRKRKCGIISHWFMVCMYIRTGKKSVKWWHHAWSDMSLLYDEWFHHINRKAIIRWITQKFKIHSVKVYFSSLLVISMAFFSEVLLNMTANYIMGCNWINLCKKSKVQSLLLFINIGIESIKSQSLYWVWNKYFESLRTFYLFFTDSCPKNSIYFVAVVGRYSTWVSWLIDSKAM